MKKRKGLKVFVIIVAVTVALVAVIAVPSKLMPTVKSSMSFTLKGENAPKLAAHRGLSSLYPQNTLPAIEKAAEYGFWGFEIDIHTTKDGEWVVIHNDTVDAMTDSEGDVSSFTLEEIKKLSIDSGNGIKNYTDLKIPTLKEALAVCENSEIVPIIEVKECDTKYFPDLAKLLKDEKLDKKAVIISFEAEYLEELRKLLAETEMMLLVHTPTKENIDFCLENGNTGIDYNHKNLYKSLSALKYARENGVKIGAWTVDNPLYADFAVRFGAELITTNKILP
ncbi:MAG: glycerophosphodiester phosphodiesterase [Acutalibacteraceae bacterium]